MRQHTAGHTARTTDTSHERQKKKGWTREQHQRNERAAGEMSACKCHSLVSSIHSCCHCLRFRCEVTLPPRFFVVYVRPSNSFGYFRYKQQKANKQQRWKSALMVMRCGIVRRVRRWVLRSQARSSAADSRHSNPQPLNAMQRRQNSASVLERDHRVMRSVCASLCALR